MQRERWRRLAWRGHATNCQRNRNVPRDRPAGVRAAPRSPRGRCRSHRRKNTASKSSMPPKRTTAGSSQRTRPSVVAGENTRGTVACTTCSGTWQHLNEYSVAALSQYIDRAGKRCRFFAWRRTPSVGEGAKLPISVPPAATTVQAAAPAEPQRTASWSTVQRRWRDRRAK